MEFAQLGRAALAFLAVVLTQTAHGASGFTRLAGSQTGLIFTNRLSPEKGFENHIRLNGAGVTAGDVDGDGWIDLFFCSVEGGSALYRNLGNWQFQNITATAGVACKEQYSAGAIFADVDGDSDLDLLVSAYETGVRLFKNDGKSRFVEDTASGLLRKFGSTTLAMADVDGNGTLDLYVATYGTTSLADQPNTRFRIEFVNGRHVVVSVNGVPTTTPDLQGRYGIDPVSGTIRENGEPDVLYLNDGHGKFRAVPWSAGAFQNESGRPLEEEPRDWGLTAMLRDMDGDGAPDIYVCNDLFSPDRFWINNGRGQFREPPAKALRCTSMFTMGIDFADINRDGFDDFVEVDMLSPDHARRMIQVVGPKPVAQIVSSIDARPQVKRNTAFLGRGDGTYAEVGQMLGLEASEWSWAPIFLDVDLDGYEDLLVTTGHARDSLHGDADAEIKRRQAARNLSVSETRDLSKLFPPLSVPKKAFRNVAGQKFVEMGSEWGFADAGISHGMCLADLDNDGDLDVVVNNLNALAGLYRNEGTAPRLGVRLKGLAPNTRGIGAKITVHGGAAPVQSQEVISGGRYLSGDDPMRAFAAGNLTNDLRVEVQWRSGRRSVIQGVKANGIREIDEAGAEPVSAEKKAAPDPMFADASQFLRHVHRDEAFDDFVKQPLLPRKLGQLGPGIAWMDMNRDGKEDLVVGSGRGGELGVFLNQGSGKFGRMGTAQLLGRPVDDQTGIVGWGGAFVLGMANYQSRQTNAVQRYELWAGGLDKKEGLPAWESSVGPISAADFDGDGDLDLFAGGRAIAGKYPMAATSRLYRHEEGAWKLARELKDVGMVSGSVLTDLDGDGDAELVLACEWGPLRVFQNERGEFREVTQALGLEKFTGWWNSVSAGDFDGDGRMDLVAGNWGRNSKYERHREFGLWLYYGDLDGDGSVELIEGYCDRAGGAVLPWRNMDQMSRGLPWIRERYPTHLAYGAATVREILGERKMRELKVETVESMVFLNRGNRFDVKPLPGEAQFSPVFGLSVGDVDGDGAEDVVLSQNFFGVDEETSRYDGGRGVWLRGDGKGGFTSVPGQESGIRAYGEGRGTALCDFDEDGRVDLAMAQNGAETKLYRNVKANPGLRVKLQGAEGNPNAVGAMLRLVNGEQMGPAREIHAGSGYWSQDSAVQVLGGRQEATALWLRWPGGKTLTVPIKPGIRDVVIKKDETFGSP